MTTGTTRTLLSHDNGAGSVQARETQNDGLERLRLRCTLLMLDIRSHVRRALDIVVSLVALMLLAPLFAAVAAAIKLTSRGPVFYVQERLAQHGRRFAMLKFRTMFTGAEAAKTALAQQQAGAMSGVRFKLKRDPRITPVGRYLRKLSIDELPQLWNVLRGDLALIGPRPPVMREVVLYDDRAMRRLEVPQGLTCLWQIRGRSDLSFQQQVELDIEYIDRSTPLEDLKILILTVPAVLSGRGAY